MIELIAAHHVSMPMLTAFDHARASRSMADNIVVRVVAGGVEGIGESVPRDYVTGETVASVLEALRSFDPRRLDPIFAEKSLADAIHTLERLALVGALTRGTTRGLAAACALEVALLDALCRRFDAPLGAVADVVLGAQRKRPAVREVRIPEYFDFSQSAEAFVDSVRTAPVHVKIKVGKDIATDAARVAAVRRAFEGVRIGVDANMAWSTDAANAAIRRLQSYDVAWFEEPVAQHAYEDCAALRTATGASIMLDESLCSFADATTAAERSACDLFNVRLSKCGGVLGSLRLIELARKRGLRYQLGVHVGESGILWAAGLRLATALEDAEVFEVGMPDRFFERTLVNEPTTTDWDRRAAQVPVGPGLGVTLDKRAIEAVQRATLRWDRANGNWESE